MLDYLIDRIHLNLTKHFIILKISLFRNIHMFLKLLTINLKEEIKKFKNLIFN